MKNKNLVKSLINTCLLEKMQWQSAISLLNHCIHCHNRNGSAWEDSRQKYLALFSPEADSSPVILTPQIQSSPWHFQVMTRLRALDFSWLCTCACHFCDWTNNWFLGVIVPVSSGLQYENSAELLHFSTALYIVFSPLIPFTVNKDFLIVSWAAHYWDATTENTIYLSQWLALPALEK